MSAKSLAKAVQGMNTAFAGADADAYLEGIDLSSLKFCLAQGFLGCRHGILNKRIQNVDMMFASVKISDLKSPLHRKIRGIELSDVGLTHAAVAKSFLKGFDAHPNGSHSSHSRNHNTAI